MNKRQKEVIQTQLDAEKAVLKRLEQEYINALNDIELNIRLLQSDELTQSRIYQLEYQKALRGQIAAILERMHGNEFNTIQEYLSQCYTDGFVGTMYDLHGQGAPVLIPIDQKAAVRAIMTDSKIQGGLYSSLGVDVTKMKKTISSEITRGIAIGLTYDDMARNISSVAKAPLSRVKTIARTEGHRIQQASTYDAQQAAKKKGANVVKQWDATLDGDTRPTHRELDGQIREIDEPFEANGMEAMFPGDFGDPAEDCNCRCVSLTRARKALDADELKRLQERAQFFGLDKTKSFEDYQRKYMNAAQRISFYQEGGKVSPPKEYDGVFDDFEELDLSKTESKAFTELWSSTQKTGNEYGAILKNGTLQEIVTSGLPDTVQISTQNYGEGVTVLHSHTNDTPPSAADFKKLLEDGVEKIGVIGYNKDAYIAYVGSGWMPTAEEFEEDLKDIRRSSNTDIMNDPNFFDWTPSERTYMAIREQAFRIARQYGWTLEGGKLEE